MRGKRSVKEAFQTFFENEIIQKYNCIFCMKSVSASKKWKLLSTPKCLCLRISDSDCDIQINRDLIIKCFTEGRVRYWKYELAWAINHVGASYDKQHYITTVQHNNTVYTLDDSKVQEKEGQAGCHPYILFYERTEEIHIDISTEWIPTVKIDESDSDDEFQIDTIIKSDGQNTENEIVTVDSNHQKQGNAKATKPKKSEHARPSERPRRILKRNRQFLDSGVWDNANNTSSSLSFHSPKPPISSTPHNLSTKTNVAIDLNDLSEKAPPKSDSPTLKVPGKTGKIGTKPKNFIRFRFQVDCTAANDVNIDELIIFLKNNMKIQGQKNNLVGVTIEKRKMNIHIMSKVMLKKKYLKSLSKKFLKKKRQMNYRVIEKNKRAYKIIAK